MRLVNTEQVLAQGRRFAMSQRYVDDIRMGRKRGRALCANTIGFVREPDTQAERVLDWLRED